MSLFDFFRPPTPRSYAKLLMKKLAIHAPDERVRFDEAAFRLLVGADGASAHLMPVLRGRGMLEYLRLMELDKEPDAPSGSLSLALSSDTALMLVHDGDDMPSQ